jgi:riboflavin synthase
MFTGLVAARGTVIGVEPSEAGARIEIDTELAAELASGDSIAINGACLTAREISGSRFQADVVWETLRRTTLGELAAGSQVNLELALRASDRLGGHFVLGHVDGVGEVRAVHESGEIEVQLDEELARYVVEKGSIAVDGVSLTVASVGDSSFTVSLIPTTLARTTLGLRLVGDAVNLEVDVMAKYAERLLGFAMSEKAMK